jgi:hypothetical protein
MSSANAYRQYLDAADLATVERAFSRICARDAIRVPSEEADNLAADLILAFQRGARSEEDLVAPQPRAKPQASAQARAQGPVQPPVPATKQDNGDRIRT